MRAQQALADRCLAALDGAHDLFPLQERLIGVNRYFRGAARAHSHRFGEQPGVLGVVVGFRVCGRHVPALAGLRCSDQQGEGHAHSDSNHPPHGQVPISVISNAPDRHSCLLGPAPSDIYQRRLRMRAVPGALVAAGSGFRFITQTGVELDDVALRIPDEVSAQVAVEELPAQCNVVLGKEPLRSFDCCLVALLTPRNPNRSTRCRADQRPIYGPNADADL